MGPKLQTLRGGQLTLYVKSQNKEGTGNIKIKMPNIEKEVSVKVINKN